MVFTISCKKSAEKSAFGSVQNDIKTAFDVATATEIIEKRCKEFEEAIKVGDSIAVGDLYTIDTKIIPSLIGRNSIITEAHEMFRDSITGMSFRIINLWGNDDIIVEDAFVEFYHSNGKEMRYWSGKKRLISGEYSGMYINLIMIEIGWFSRGKSR